jgi:hypothetical protein
MAGPNPGNPYSAVLGASGSCAVVAGNGCAWTVGVSDNWIQIQGAASGSGSGTVNFSLLANSTTSSRTGTINLQGQGASCQVRQNGILGAAPAATGTLTSELTVGGASGQVVVDGVDAYYQGEGPLQTNLPDEGPPLRRAVATLVTGGRPGQWRFRVQGIRPGTLRVVAGEVATVTDDTVAFRLAGKPGERVMFLFRLE